MIIVRNNKYCHSYVYKFFTTCNDHLIKFDRKFPFQFLSFFVLFFIHLHSEIKPSCSFNFSSTIFQIFLLLLFRVAIF